MENEERTPLCIVSSVVAIVAFLAIAVYMFHTITDIVMYITVGK